MNAHRGPTVTDSLITACRHKRDTHLARPHRRQRIGYFHFVVVSRNRSAMADTCGQQTGTRKKGKDGPVGTAATTRACRCNKRQATRECGGGYMGQREDLSLSLSRPTRAPLDRQMGQPLLQTPRSAFRRRARAAVSGRCVEDTTGTYALSKIPFHEMPLERIK